MVRDRVFIASIVAVIVAMVEADQKESTRMVYDETTDPGSLVESSRKVESSAVAEGWSAGAACSAISDESACAMRSGCAWCLRNSTLKLPGTRSFRIVSTTWGAIQGERRGGGGMRMLLQEGDESAEEHVRSCSAWNECTGPESLCELIISESACMGNIVQTGSSCVWCKSEGRCLSTTDSSGKELTGSSSAQCRGCDGVFDSTSSLDPCGVCGGTNSTCTPTAYRLSFTRHEKIGITLALVGNVLISVSLNTQKYAHNKNEERGAHKLSYLKLKLWWVGMVLMAIGETGNFLAYAYAPATVVAPLGAASVVSNCFLASFILKEHIGIRNILGVALAILGSVIIVLYAPASDRQLTMDVLVHYMTEWSFVVMVSLIVLVILVLFSLKDSIKKRYVVVYTLICSLTGALTVMCIKGVSTALVLTLQVCLCLCLCLCLFLVCLCLCVYIIQRVLSYCSLT
jgi:drug/metabolite transporter (DMT)-like permease